jgi:hypothetical protein
MESCFVSQHFSLGHSFASARNRCRASDGGNIFSAKLLATAAKSFWLKVTSRSARPLTAVSSTISSAGSDRSGLHRNLICTASPTLTSELMTSSSSCTLRRCTFLCSSRVKTASYSRTRGTDNRSVNFLANARFTSCHEAPPRLRIAATRTSVSSTRHKRDDIAYDITFSREPGASLPLCQIAEANSVLRPK